MAAWKSLPILWDAIISVICSSDPHYESVWENCEGLPNKKQTRNVEAGNDDETRPRTREPSPVGLIKSLSSVFSNWLQVPATDSCIAQYSAGSLSGSNQQLPDTPPRSLMRQGGVQGSCKHVPRARVSSWEPHGSAKLQKRLVSVRAYDTPNLFT